MNIKKLKVVGFNTRTFGKGTNPNGGRWVEFEDERGNTFKVNQLKVTHAGGMPFADGPTENFKILNAQAVELGFNDLFEFAEKNV